jgi:hypothetical protein
VRTRTRLIASIRRLRASWRACTPGSAKNCARIYSRRHSHQQVQDAPAPSDVSMVVKDQMDAANRYVVERAEGSRRSAPNDHARDRAITHSPMRRRKVISRRFQASGNVTSYL